MSRRNGWRRIFRMTESRRHVEAQVDEELDFLIENLLERYSAQGLSKEEALAEIQRRFNGLETTRTALITRSERTLRRSKWRFLLDGLRYDLKSGLRQMLRSPGFTVIALGTIALGIGANTAIFSLVNGVLLKPLPYPETDRVVRLWETNLPRGWRTFSIAPLNYWDWQERNQALELLAAYRVNTVNHTGGDRPEILSAIQVTEDYLKILGQEPSRGRGITAKDLDPAEEAVVILSNGFWQSQLGGAPDVLDRTMILDGVVHSIVGVLPADERILAANGIDLILPLRPEPYWYAGRSSHFLRAMGRLKTGVTIEQAREEFSSIAATLEAEYPDSNAGWGAEVRLMEEVILRPIKPQVLAFMVCAGLILLIACANLANMMLARGTIRTRELAIRSAMGAGRGRVVCQLVTESLLLAVVGGVLGVILAWFALHVFAARGPAALVGMYEIDINATVLLFSLGLSLVSGIMFGLLPAASVVGPNLAGSLQQWSRSLAGNRFSRRIRIGLVVGEVSLAAVLLVGTGLLVRTFSALQSEDPGFRTEDRLILSTPLPSTRYDTDDRIRSFADETLDRLKALPGVESVALSSLIPFRGSDQIWGIWIEGYSHTSPDGDGSVLFYRVSSDYFDTMGIPLLEGRALMPEDRQDGHRVVVISESLSRLFFPDTSPLGQVVRFGGVDNPPVEIVGVVGDVQHYRLGQTSMPQVYLPFPQRPYRDISFIIRTSTDPMSLVHGVRAVIEAVDPDQPLQGIRTVDALVSNSIAVPRIRMLLMTGSGLVALLLAVMGLYGVMACSVSQRTREIGVRMALGATSGSLLGMIFREGLLMVGMGLVIGLGGALVLGRALESMLFGVGAGDPIVYVSVLLVLSVVAAVALLIPARRATRVDPVRTLGEG